MISFTLKLYCGTIIFETNHNLHLISVLVEWNKILLNCCGRPVRSLGNTRVNVSSNDNRFGENYKYTFGGYYIIFFSIKIDLNLSKYIL